MLGNGLLAKLRSNSSKQGENDGRPSSTSIKEPQFSLSNHVLQAKTHNFVNLLRTPNQR